VQDSLITVLSEKTLPIPELGSEVQAAKGFSVIATANNRTRAVNELSAALKRRFKHRVCRYRRARMRRFPSSSNGWPRWAGHCNCRPSRRP